MGKSYFGVEVDEEILKEFKEKIMKDYYHGKIRDVVEEFMKRYLQDAY